jgi:hypothetical protein
MFHGTCPRLLRCVYSWVYSEKYYTTLIEDPELHVKLTGGWETTVGPELDTFCTPQTLYRHFCSPEILTSRIGTPSAYSRVRELLWLRSIDQTYPSETETPGSFRCNPPIFNFAVLTAMPGVRILPFLSPARRGRYLRAAVLYSQAGIPP